MIDLTLLSDTELAAHLADVSAEVGRRQKLTSIPVKMEALVLSFLDAEGTVPGEEWRAPTGAHDAYPAGWQVERNGKVWESLTPGNVWEPGASGWREVAQGSEAAEWVAPTGTHDAYNIGDRVLFEGSEFDSLIDANTWSPSDYPQGWKLVAG